MFDDKYIVAKELSIPATNSPFEMEYAKKNSNPSPITRLLIFTATVLIDIVIIPIITLPATIRRK